jgi:hypothetical protein
MGKNGKSTLVFACICFRELRQVSTSASCTRPTKSRSMSRLRSGSPGRSSGTNSYVDSLRRLRSALAQKRSPLINSPARSSPEERLRAGNNTDNTSKHQANHFRYHIEPARRKFRKHSPTPKLIDHTGVSRELQSIMHTTNPIVHPQLRQPEERAREERNADCCRLPNLYPLPT